MDKFVIRGGEPFLGQYASVAPKTPLYPVWRPLCSQMRPVVLENIPQVRDIPDDTVFACRDGC